VVTSIPILQFLVGLLPVAREKETHHDLTNAGLLLVHQFLAEPTTAEAKSSIQQSRLNP
jgi:hypothetical protein